MFLHATVFASITLYLWLLWYKLKQLCDHTETEHTNNLLEIRQVLSLEANQSQKMPNKLSIYHKLGAFSHQHSSAQLPIEFKTGEMVTGGVKEQAESVFFEK